MGIPEGAALAPAFGPFGVPTWGKGRDSDGLASFEM